jgi:hypothetical protein
MPAADCSPSNITAISSRVGPLVSGKKKNMIKHSKTRLGKEIVSVKVRKSKDWIEIHTTI